MRLVISALALATAAALAPPAHAAAAATCAVALVHDAVGTSAECSTTLPNTGYRAYRWLRVEVVSGTVDASIACTGYGSRATRVTGPGSSMISISANTSAVCWARLVAVTAGPKAAGVSGMTPDLIDE